jgi:hypothetical protein
MPEVVTAADRGGRIFHQINAISSLPQTISRLLLLIREMRRKVRTIKQERLIRKNHSDRANTLLRTRVNANHITPQTHRRL